MANEAIVNMNSARPHSQARPRHSFLSIIIFLFVSSLTGLAIYLFIGYFFFPPDSPIVYADSLSLSSSNLSSPPSSLLTATWLLGLSFQNPNSDTYLSYDHIEATVYYNSQPLSTTALAPFEQPWSNQTTVLAMFVAAGAYVGEGMREERREYGSVEFDVRMIARVRAWTARPRFLRVYCERLEVMFSRYGWSGSMEGAPRQCRVQSE